jgi:hypothetical protein
MIKTNPYSTDPALIAPCGINCRLCRAYDREMNSCPGCRADDSGKSKSCLACRIKNCEKLAPGHMQFCFECGEFPCQLVTHLDKRYRTKYATSPIENLVSIQTLGIIEFVKFENKKWACPECGAMLCMHKPQCLSCGYLWHK